MGTSGAYGGSGTVAWNKVEELLNVMESPARADDVAGEDTGDSGGDAPSPSGDLLAAIGDALLADDPRLSFPSAPTPPSPGGDSGLNLSGILPVRRGGGGGGTRAGRPSRRDVVGGARRAGRALGAAYALQRGDAVQLATYGLDLDDLLGKSRIEQILAIVNTLGESTPGPDEQALRNAVVSQLNRVLTDDASDPADALRDLIVDYCIDRAYVEVEAVAARLELTHHQLLEVEGQIRSLARAKAARLDLEGALLIRPAQFEDAAEIIVRGVVVVMMAVLT